MKKLVLTGLVVLMAGSVYARSDRKYGSAGCGLGNMAFGKRDNQVLAATTNGLSWNQTFGISSGTSNCVDDEPQARRREAKAFIHMNEQNLANDAARGEGEYLNTVADILGATNREAFARSVQAHHSEIFTKHATPETVVDSMTSLL